MEVRQRLRYRPSTGGSLADEQVEQQQVGIDPVALGQVHPEPEPARLLGAHHRPGLDHLRADELEADRRLVGLDAVALAESRGHRGVVDADDDRVAPAPVLGEVVHQQPGDLELVDERAALVGRAGPVGVAVEEEAQVMAAGRQDAQRLVDVRPDRLRVDAAEVRVALLVDLVDPDPTAGEQAADPAGAGAPHRVDEHVEVRRLERIEVDRAPDELLVALERIEPLDEPGRLGVGQRPALDALGAVHRRAAPRRRTGSRDRRPRPSGALTLKPLSTHGLWLAVMTIPAAAPRVDDLVRAHLRRDGVDREEDRDVVRQQDLGRGLGEMLGGEPPVEGDDHAPRRGARPGDIVRDAIRAAADVIEGELVGDACPPAIRAEDDGRWRAGSGRRRHSASCLGTALDELADALDVAAPIRGGPRSAAWRSCYRSPAGR